MILLVRKYLLLPITALWAAILKFRHLLYNNNILSTYSPNVKSICVGNLAFGGTGKTPYIEYLISDMLKYGYKNIAVISRGYGRKSKDLVFAKVIHSTDVVGDEPLQIKRKFGNNITVVVCANRKRATEQLLLEKPLTDLIIYDDALQHRKIKASTNILLTTFSKPFWSDSLFPSGSLRDVKSRADFTHEIVVTKCPESLSSEQKKYLRNNLPKGKEITFSTIKYLKPTALFENKELQLNSLKNVVLVTGIANTKSLIGYLKSEAVNFEHIKFPDHHNFTLEDLKRISKSLKKNSEKNIVLTTEKDAVRLLKFRKEIENFALEIYYLPISFKMI